MRFKKLLTNKLFILLAIFTTTYLIYGISFKQYHDVWWDAASYIGAGKFIFSNGQVGVFEPMKPILLPILLGIFYKLGLNMVIFGKILIFIFSLMAIAFCYLIGREFFDENTAFISSLILFMNPLFFVFTFRIYTEMLSICFILGGIFFMIKTAKSGKGFFVFLSALFCTLAFMTKYPNALLAIILNIFLAYFSFKKKSAREFILFNLFFIVFASSFFALGYFVGGEPLYLWHTSQEYFKANLGHMYDLRAFPGVPRTFFATTDFIYFKTILFLFNVLLPFIFIGIFKIFKEKNKRNEKILLLLVPAVLFFVFYEIFYLKQDRYIVLIFPFLAMFSAYGMSRIKNWKRVVLITIYLIVSLVAIMIALNLSQNEMAYWKFYSEPPINISCKNVATCDPRSILRYDNVVFPYEVFDKTWNGEFIKKENPDCIFYFSCYEGREEHMKIIGEFGYKQVYKRDNGRCVYTIFTK